LFSNLHLPDPRGSPAPCPLLPPSASAHLSPPILVRPISPGLHPRHPHAISLQPA
jgi:hypothetical protein